MQLVVLVAPAGADIDRIVGVVVAVGIRTLEPVWINCGCQCGKFFGLKKSGLCSLLRVWIS